MAKKKNSKKKSSNSRGNSHKTQTTAANRGRPRNNYNVGSGDPKERVSVSGSFPTLSECLEVVPVTDAVGRMVCEHKREYCHLCSVDFRLANRLAEETAGLKQRSTPLETAANLYALTLRSIRGMESMRPRLSREIDKHYRLRDEHKAKAQQEAAAEVAAAAVAVAVAVASNNNHRRANEKKEEEEKHDTEMLLEAALEKAIHHQRSDELEIEALMQMLSRMNPGQKEFGLQTLEQQRIYDEYVKAPEPLPGRADYYTCSYCGSTGTTKIHRSPFCKTVSYCGRPCQLAAWPSHKLYECNTSSPEADQGKDPKKLQLTWGQVEAHAGLPSHGKLQVKAIKDESYPMRQVFQCRDRAGECRKIAVYTESGSLDGLGAGSIVTWKNPRFHTFLDGSCGGRIDENDLMDIVITPSNAQRNT